MVQSALRSLGDWLVVGTAGWSVEQLLALRAALARKLHDHKAAWRAEAAAQRKKRAQARAAAKLQLQHQEASSSTTMAMALEEEEEQQQEQEAQLGGQALLDALRTLLPPTGN